jgi:hypothetical protein
MFRLRNFTPSGLYWRTALIVIVPATILQLIITLVFLDDHWRFTSKRMSQAVAADVTLLLQMYEGDPTPETFARVRRCGSICVSNPARLWRERPAEPRARASSIAT